MRSIIQRGAVAVAVTGALITGVGVGTASAATVTDQATPAAQATAYPRWDVCDNFNRRFDRDCRTHDRWYWDGGHRRWTHWRWDGHRWVNRGWR
jgi:hypothetical protein